MSQIKVTGHVINEEILDTTVFRAPVAVINNYTVANMYILIDMLCITCLSI